MSIPLTLIYATVKRPLKRPFSCLKAIMPLGVGRKTKFVKIKNPAKQKTLCSKIVCCINLTIILACSGSLIFQAVLNIQKYLKYETRTLLTVKNTGDTTFLAFTICPTFHDAYKEDVLARFGTTKDAYKAGNFISNST